MKKSKEQLEKEAQERAYKNWKLLEQIDLDDPKNKAALEEIKRRRDELNKKK